MSGVGVVSPDGAPSRKDLRERIAEAILRADKASPVESLARYEPTEQRSYRGLAAAALAALDAAGFAVVQLPEPDAEDTDWYVDDHDALVVIRGVDGKIANNGVSNPYPSPAYARAHAAALLAAVAAVEARAVSGDEK